MFRFLMQSNSHDISQRQVWDCNLLEVDKIKINVKKELSKFGVLFETEERNVFIDEE